MISAMTRAIEIAEEKGVTPETVHYYARKFLFGKTGRDYIFTEAQANRIRAAIGGKPGPKRKRSRNGAKP